MNIEQTKEAIRIMQAFVDGKEVHSRCLGIEEWREKPAAFTWNWRDFEYRIKPTLKLRPWTADEMPLGAQMRSKLDPSRRWLACNTGTDNDRMELLETSEHSIDNGKTWHPCGVMEESK
jgi:hypothetical protein